MVSTSSNEAGPLASEDEDGEPASNEDGEPASGDDVRDSRDVADAVAEGDAPDATSSDVVTDAADASDSDDGG